VPTILGWAVMVGTALRAFAHPTFFAHRNDNGK
jgi:hypothetical protein